MFIAKNSSLNLSNNGNKIIGTNGGYWGVASLSDTEYSSGKVTFSCKLDKLNYVAIGVGSISSDLSGYYPVGKNANQRGFNLGNSTQYPSEIVSNVTFAEGDVVTVDIDFDAGTMTYMKNGVPINVSFNDLNTLPKPLYVLCDVVNTSELSLCENPVIQERPTLSATAGDSKVNLYWNTITDATGYNVKCSTTAGGPYTIVGSNVVGISYIDSTATNGITYYYIVTALNGTDESGNSNEVPATPTAGVVTPPTPAGQELLRIIMSDSSEREYKVTQVVVEGFINWFNRNNITIDNTSYMFNKAIDDSKEYLSCSKIISFETIVTNEQTLLRITMSDSSEREYKVSATEVDNFIKWFKDTAETPAKFYLFNKAIDNSKEYLFFDKIISFEVMSLA